MISLETARQLLNFAGGSASQQARIGLGAAESQLQGAVAIHNMLEQRRVAYLADEVGLGKTYVALGAVALFRHFNPRFRLLVVAPKRTFSASGSRSLAISYAITSSTLTCASNLSRTHRYEPPSFVQTSTNSYARRRMTPIETSSFD